MSRPRPGRWSARAKTEVILMNGGFTTDSGRRKKGWGDEMLASSPKPAQVCLYPDEAWMTWAFAFTGVNQ